MRTVQWVLATIPALAWSQGLIPLTQDEARAIRQTAMKLVDATTKGDCNAVVALTNPRLIAAAGGTDGLIAACRTSIARVQSSKTRVLAADVHEPVMLAETPTHVLALVPVTLTTDTPKTIAVSKGCMVASASKRSSAWRFVDCAGVPDRAAAEALFPGIPPGVTIPKATHEVKRKKSG